MEDIEGAEKAYLQSFDGTYHSKSRKGNIELELSSEEGSLPSNENTRPAESLNDSEDALQGIHLENKDLRDNDLSLLREATNRTTFFSGSVNKHLNQSSLEVDSAKLGENTSSTGTVHSLQNANIVKPDDALNATQRIEAKLKNTKNIPQKNEYGPEVLIEEKNLCEISVNLGSLEFNNQESSESINKSIDPCKTKSNFREVKNLLSGNSKQSADCYNPVDNCTIESTKPYQFCILAGGEEEGRPPIPLQTYRWEDIKRAKQQGGYPWTHLYKQPLAPNEEPEFVLKYKIKDTSFGDDSPKTSKKVRICETRDTIDLQDSKAQPSGVEHAPEYDELLKEIEGTVCNVNANDQQDEICKEELKKPIRRKVLEPFKTKAVANTENSTEESPKESPCCHPLVDKLRTMADKQFSKHNIKKVPLKQNERIVLEEEQKILQLKISPKAERGEIPHFVEKQDSDEVIEILELEESPSKARKRRSDAILHPTGESVPVPDEIIEISDYQQSKSLKINCGGNTLKESTTEQHSDVSLAPLKNQKEHLYEEINSGIAENLNEILEQASIKALKLSLGLQDSATMEKIQCKADMSENLSDSEEVNGKHSPKCAPISTIESESFDEEKKISMLPTIEELDLPDSIDLKQITNKTEIESAIQCETGKEVFPFPEKKVTFFKKNGQEEMHQKDDIALPESHTPKRWSKMSDHEYEPIGEPCSQYIGSDVAEAADDGVIESKKEQLPRYGNDICKTSANMHAENLRFQDGNSHSNIDESDDKSCISLAITSRSESRADEVHTSQVDSSAIESLPLKTESRKKSFMANAQDKSRRVQQNLRTQAGKLKTKLSGMKKPVTGSPKIKERKKFLGRDFAKVKIDIKKPEFPKFRAPDMSKFQKLKAPNISKFHKFKTPDMSKFKNPKFGKIEFKRPEFTKFSKPDLSKFKIPEKFSSLKLRRSRSLKEPSSLDETAASSMEPSEPYQEKKMFEFHFATYPRILRKKKIKELSHAEPQAMEDFRSTESPTSTESNNITVPRSLGQGLVGSNWVDKFSDVSYGDSESGKYQRYDSEPENDGSTDKVHHNMDLHPEDYDASSPISTKLENMHSDEMKQLAAYDEENRAIHEISKIREGEFKMRKPIIHQDSDLVSEESKEFGWTDKDILKHNILSRSETDFEKTSGDLNNLITEDQKASSVENTNPDTQSTASSNAFRRKGVLEEIDDDEFFLRKKGISEENIQIREYISSAIREGLSSGENALAHISNDPYYSNKPSASDEIVNYAYDVPPPKPKRIKGSGSTVSEDFRNDSSQGLNAVDTSEVFEKPSRPSRKPKPKKEIEISFNERELPYFDEEHLEDNGYDVPRSNSPVRDVTQEFQLQTNEPPKAPKRRKKYSDKTLEETDFKGFVENPTLNHFSPEDTEREIVVYRTEHEYIIPLAQIETFSSTPVPAPRRSRSRSRSQTSHFTDDDHISYGAESVNSELGFADYTKNEIEVKEGDGYAIIKREPPPRPPAPTRRKKSSSSLEEKRFSTLPLSKKSSDRLDPSTVDADESTRLSRGRSVSSLEEVSNRKTEIINGMQYEYEELDNDEIQTNDISKKLQSGDIVNKMKYRPLPPPPRPPREGRKNKEEKLKCSDIQDIDIEEPTKICDEKLFVEVEVSTQTDPLPDDFECEEFEITDDMRIIEPRKTKTLEDILKQEQEAELERAKQLAEDDALSRSIQKFRESNQRSFSEKSKASTSDNVKGSSSRPNTPSAILIERRIPTPVSNQVDQMAVQASLTVKPICERDLNDLSKFEIESDIENDKNDEKRNENEPKENINFQEFDFTEPPNPPPRKKTSIDEDQTNINMKTSQNQVSNSTTRLTELEVDHLSVRAIEAGKIMVSQLDGSSISVQDFECKSGNLTISNFELPPGFIDGIVDRIRASEREYLESLTQKVLHEEPPARPPPPEQHHLPLDYVQAPVHAQTLSQVRQTNENEYQSSNVHKRRRHHRRRDSSSSDMQKDSRSSRSTRTPEASISQLSGQLLSACGATALRTINQILNLLNISEKELNNQNMKIVVIIFIIMTLGFLLMGMAGAKNIHHHHWDYFNPPGNTRS